MKTQSQAVAIEKLHQIPLRLRRSTYDKLRRIIYLREFRSANAAVTALIEESDKEEVSETPIR